MSTLWCNNHLGLITTKGLAKGLMLNYETSFEIEEYLWICLLRQWKY